MIVQMLKSKPSNRIIHAVDLSISLSVYRSIRGII